ncbi:alcohol dehydrogenase catalytic domain-containing protein [Streptomyces sp. AV19]|uniref:zinc-binding dehydrogenase n=1 Tax=Streptomyces sp. AV19 TaxID=2793068 RepID=UPI0018FF0D68|nr:alcohol dehydrogenase catalytic domain-containing protein [Streptomyces sp. AV19]MBH1937465.1 alcohol dehydrogenase catalytic domain-containing protein [Streptomyces sp. AV19]MDG4533762.1 alcohol dehydrogenase catalytic domain-containing protein [Streptomyces sp. AV19]
MRAAVLHGPRDVRAEEVPDPSLVEEEDAVVRVVAAAVCGSDLWAYRGITPLSGPARSGHEFVGTVEAVGSAVRTLRPGDFVVAPFNISDNTCPNCRNGIHTSCDRIAHWGVPGPDGRAMDAGQGEAVRVPLADGTLVPTPGPPAPERIPALLALCDVMATGHHAARIARVGPGDSVVVVGDGAVGLCAVLASRAAGAERVVVMSRHPARQALALEFGATDIVAARGQEGVAEVRGTLGGPADCSLECVGTDLSLRQAVGTVRPGGRVGCVGLPLGITRFPHRELFTHNLSFSGGGAPARAYLPELLRRTWDGELAPGRVFDGEFPLHRVADAYAAMDDRKVIKALLRP